jgi:hypothetical protein
VTGGHLAGDAPVPAPPPGHGAVVLTLWFDSTVELGTDDRVVDERPNYDIWIPAPVVRIDGVPVPVSWARWWYPLPAGPHEVEVARPVAATRRVQLADGVTVALAYRARLRIRKDATDTRVLGQGGTATLDLVES